MSSIPSLEEMRANLPCHQSILDAPPEEKVYTLFFMLI